MSAPQIHRLSADLVNKIAAGEVVERPASVIKELVENAIDAGARRIEVALEDGGKRLIRVSDDGLGMSAEDLPLALEPHATSKISRPDDLSCIETLGFRGEALASIAAVSRCRIVSRRRGAPDGAAVECQGGDMGDVRACGAPEGTLLEIRDLFFNTPARLKFLRSTATELRHAIEMLTRLALPNPAIALALTHNGRSVLKLDAASSWPDRLAALFGRDLAETLLPVESRSAALAIGGYVSPPGAGQNSPLQYVFLNGRYIRDRAIQRAIAEAYRSRLLRGKFPAAFLDLQLDPRRVDVNVHPTKIEVRFRDSGAVFAQTLAALETALRAAGPLAGSLAPAEPAPVSHSERRENVRRAVAEFFERPTARAEPPPFLRPQTPRPQTGEIITPPASEPSTQHPTPQTQSPNLPSSQSPLPPIGPPPGRFFQVHNAYIVEEVPGGFLLIDQHALHERILYEDLRRRVAQSSVPRQRLLTPEIIDLRPQDYLRVMELKETLLKMGLEVESFGDRTVAVQAVPHMLTGADPRELLFDILKEAAESAEGRPGERQESLMRIVACKAAVKAGDALSPARIQALLEQRRLVGPEPTCPHGRPTTLRFDLRDLERQFRRT